MLWNGKTKDLAMTLAIQNLQERFHAATSSCLCGSMCVFGGTISYTGQRYKCCGGTTPHLWPLQQLRIAPGNVQEGRTSSFLPMSHSSLSVQGPIIWTVTQHYLVLHDGGNIWQTLNNSGTTWGWTNRTFQFPVSECCSALFCRRKEINLLTLFCYCSFPESEREKIIVFLFIRHCVLLTEYDTQDRFRCGNI